METLANINTPKVIFGGGLCVVPPNGRNARTTHHQNKAEFELGSRSFDARPSENEGEKSSLGNITKIRAIEKNQGFDAYQELLQSFVLQDVASSILTEREIRINKKGEQYNALCHRVGYCLKQRVSCEHGVGVRYNVNRKKAHYDNLVRCGSVWTCPFCGRKISQARCDELAVAMDRAKSKGWFVYMLTFTNRHYLGDNLVQLLSGQKDAFELMFRQRAVREMLASLGYQGRIRATEVTYGQNGWHPHFHVLIFFDHEINAQGLQSFFATQWQKSCVKKGMKAPSLEHGVDVKQGKAVVEGLARYMSKWGLEHEMTKGHIKKGKNDGLTPFDLLRLVDENPKYRQLFRQFADAFKGKNQLVWSRGLKDLLGVTNRTDEQISQETDKESVEVREIATQIWRLVLKYKFRGELLKACELDYLDGGGGRVNALILYYAEIEQERRNSFG